MHCVCSACSVMKSTSLGLAVLPFHAIRSDATRWFRKILKSSKGMLLFYWVWLCPDSTIFGHFTFSFWFNEIFIQHLMYMIFRRSKRCGLPIKCIKFTLNCFFHSFTIRTEFSCSDRCYEYAWSRYSDAAGAASQIIKSSPISARFAVFART